MQGDTAEAQAELEALRRERALLIDKLNNHPEVRKYAGGMPLRDYYPSKFHATWHSRGMPAGTLSRRHLLCPAV